MARYIDAELLLADNTYEWFDDWGNYTSAGQAIVDAPTADVVEVVHGEWERIEKKDEIRIINVDFRCSACRRFRFHNGELLTYKFCPNCGAKMDVI